MVYLPMIAKKIKVSFTILLTVLGVLISFIFGSFSLPSPLDHTYAFIKYSEFIVIISVLIAGVKIGLKYSMKEWKTPIKLVLIAMPLFMLSVALSFYYVLQLPLATSVLIAAALAPTDPVLASELQLQKKQKAKDKDVGLRYLLTAEAGLNDGLAFPFVYLAIVLSTTPNFGSGDLIDWLSFYVVYKIVVGIICGALCGAIFSKSVYPFYSNNLSKSKLGFVGLSLLLTAYGVAELLNGYGFLSVFFAGLLSCVVVHKKGIKVKEAPILPFIEDIEKFLTVIWLIYFGGYIMVSDLFVGLNWKMAAIVLSTALVIRPLTAYLAISQCKYELKEKVAASFFGIRGIGSVFYVTYALNNGQFEDAELIIKIVFLTLLSSILIHGLTSKRVLNFVQGKK